MEQGADTYRVFFGTGDPYLRPRKKDLSFGALSAGAPVSHIKETSEKYQSKRDIVKPTSQRLDGGRLIDYEFCWRVRLSHITFPTL